MTLNLWTILKVAIAVMVIAFGAIMADRYEGWIRRLIKPEGPPMKTRPLPLGTEISGERERKDINRVSQEYGRVKVLVDGARGKGADVANLDKMLVFSLTLARQKKYDAALTLLNRIAMDIPRPKEPVTAARFDDPLPAEPAIKAVPVKRKAPSTPSPRKRRRSGE